MRSSRPGPRAPPRIRTRPLRGCREEPRTDPAWYAPLVQAQAPGGDAICSGFVHEDQDLEVQRQLRGLIEGMSVVRWTSRPHAGSAANAPRRRCGARADRGPHRRLTRRRPAMSHGALRGTRMSDRVEPASAASNLASMTLHRVRCREPGGPAILRPMWRVPRSAVPVVRRAERRGRAVLRGVRQADRVVGRRPAHHGGAAEAGPGPGGAQPDRRTSPCECPVRGPRRLHAPVGPA